MNNPNGPDIAREVQRGIRREKTSESLAVILFVILCAVSWGIGSTVSTWAGIVLLLVGAVFIWSRYTD